MCNSERRSLAALKVHIEEHALIRLIRRDERFDGFEPQGVVILLKAVIDALQCEFPGAATLTQVYNYLGEEATDQVKQLFNSLYVSLFAFGVEHGFLVQEYIARDYVYSLGEESSKLIVATPQRMSSDIKGKV